MSAVSSVSSNAGSSLYQFLQSIAAQSNGQTANTASTQGVQGAHHHHHHGGGGQGGNGLFQQIQSAVTSALQSNQPGSSSSDPNQVITQAIAQVLQGGTNPTSGTAAAGGTAPAAGAVNGAGSGGNNSQAFFQSLQALGVTPEQFRSDFLAALKQVQSGQTNSNSAVASPLTGLAVDANA